MPTGIQPPGRVIWYNDGDDLTSVAFGQKTLWNARDPGGTPLPERFASPQDLINLRLTGIAKTPADTISYCGLFVWPCWQLPRERTAALGEDPLRAIVDFTHDCGKEFFFNLRMNDCHSSGQHWRGPAYWEPFRMAHLDCLQSTIPPAELASRYLPWIRGEASVYPLQEVLERRGGGNRDVQSWAAYDYAKPEVRSYFLDCIRTACERYDLDGIDLDWLRAPYFFRFGEERRRLPLMNDFVRRAAETIREVARSKGKRITIAMRVPDTPIRALEVGLDVGTWLASGWIDLLIAGNGLSVFSAPLAPWQELARPNKVPVYACVSRSAQGLADPALFRGACQRQWAQGAHGLYLFNHFIPDEYGWIDEVARSSSLNALPLAYALDAGTPFFENGTVELGPLPLDFSDLTAPLMHSFSIEIPEWPRTRLKGALAVKWRAAPPAQGILWELNGELVGPLDPLPDGAIRFGVHALRAGANELRVTVPPAQRGLILEAVKVTLDPS
ncbi:MAG: hypothetical protein J0L75_00505 [Spirochaetes bacterium]|nr:hypothetical protein [Spirochaetota bacterium]